MICTFFALGLVNDSSKDIDDLTLFKNTQSMKSDSINKVVHYNNKLKKTEVNAELSTLALLVLHNINSSLCIQTHQKWNESKQISQYLRKFNYLYYQHLSQYKNNIENISLSKLNTIAIRNLFILQGL